MKKLLLALLIVGSLALTGCGNADLSMGSYSFHYVHVQMYNQDHPEHFKVTKWKSDEGGIELAVEGYGRVLLGDGTYMMYDSVACPLCGEVTYKGVGA